MEIKTMSEYQEIKAKGFERGFNIASWQDIPEIGETVPRDIDWIGIRTIEDEDEQREVLEMMATAGEENDRQFSPFEFTAKGLNEREDADEAWQEYDDGIIDGIHENIRQRFE